MLLNFKEFVDLVFDWLSGTTITYSGQTYSMDFVMKIDSKDRITAFRGKSYPSAYITPISFAQSEYGKSKYMVRIYFADKLNKDRSNYFDILNNLTMFVQGLYQQIPHNYNKFIYPTTYNIVLLWDDYVEGFYIDFGIVATNHCYII